MAVAFAAATCGGEGKDRPAGVLRADSGGVTIIRSSNPGPLRGTLVAPPLHVFGAEAEGPEFFGDVADAWLHPSGSLWIAERFTQEIRVFDAGSGAHRFTIGGIGEGPGEFRRLRMLGFSGEGNAHVFDDRLRRISEFSQEGKLVRVQAVPQSSDIPARPLHITRSGDLLGQLPQALSTVLPDRVTVRDTVGIWRIPLNGESPSIVATFLGPLWYISDGMQVVVPYTGALPPPFGGGAVYAFRDERVYVAGEMGTPSVSVFGRRGLERRMELVREAREPGDLSARVFAEHLRRARWPESQVQFYEHHLQDMPLPDVVWRCPGSVDR